MDRKLSEEERKKERKDIWTFSLSAIILNTEQNRPCNAKSCIIITRTSSDDCVLCIELMDKGAGQWLRVSIHSANSTQDFCDYRARPSRKWISFYGLVTDTHVTFLCRFFWHPTTRRPAGIRFSTGFSSPIWIQSIVNIQVTWTKQNKTKQKIKL